MAKQVVKSTADIRTRFLKQTQAIQKGANSVAEALTKQTRPEKLPLDKNGWDGNILDPKGFAKPFDRQEHHDDVTKAVTDPANAGTVGDLAVSAVQGDFLAAMERSQRLLHSTHVRLVVHASARKYGHGHAAGLFERGYQAYISGFLTLARAK